MIEIIPKRIRKAPEWQKLGFYIAVALLIAVVLGYGLMFYFEAKAWGKLQAVEENITKVGTKEEKALEAEVLLAQKRINAFANLLESHKKTSNFFILLEESCHPDVWLTEVNLRPEESAATVSGKTASFRNLGEQVLILREQPLIKSIELTNLQIGDDGLAEFTFHLDLNPQIFHE